MLEGLIGGTRELSASTTRGAADILAIFDRLGDALDQGSVAVVVNSLLILNTKMKEHHSRLLASRNNDPAQFRDEVVSSARVARETATSLAGAMDRLTLVEGLTGHARLMLWITDRLEPRVGG